MPSHSPLVHVAEQLIHAFNTLPETEASGLYPAKALINHSCDANAAIEWRFDSSVLCVVATRPIRAGEEVCHCYISLEQHQGLRARRAALQAHSHAQYGGFICSCVRCVADLSAEASTSEELIAAFEDAQALEEAGCAARATCAYEEICQRYDTPALPRFDCTAPPGDVAPCALVVSTCLNCLGGCHLDAGRLREAHSAFERSLDVWPSSSMALVNLGDLERKRGDAARALAYYERAAALPPVPSHPHSTYHSTWVGTPRAECVAMASAMCALLLHQSNRFESALPYLARFGARFRIAPGVWQLVNGPRPSLHLLRLAPPDAPVYRCVDGIAPTLLAVLKRAFAPSAPFWAETAYAAGSYYSFYYRLSDPPSNAVEQLARVLLPLARCQTEEVVGCSWWAHAKPYGEGGLGHQLHFDTEERALNATGEVLHPAVTTVTYLSEGGAPLAEAAALAAHASASTSASAYSPTVIFDQRVADCSARARGARVAHVVHPIEGTTLFYPGDRLHGVCPAPEGTPAASAPPSASHPPNEERARKRHCKASRHSDGLEQAEEAPRDESLQPATQFAPRITLMISFWTRAIGPRDVPAAARRASTTGVCAAVPPSTRSCSWPRTLDLDPELPNWSRAAPAPRIMEVPAVADPWQPIPAAQPDAWQGLRVPEERDTHFFVRSMAELHGCYGNE